MAAAWAGVESDVMMPPADWNLVLATLWPLVIALLIGLLVRQLLLRVARRTSAAQRTWALVVTAIAIPAAVALPLLFLSLAVNATPLPPHWAAGIQHWVGIGGIACLTW